MTGRISTNEWGDEITTRVLSVVGNTGVRVESVSLDERNRTIEVFVIQPDKLIRNAAQRIAQRIAPDGWTVEVKECS
jgi:hypothetical protein